MTEPDEFVVQPLAPGHDRGAFKCGIAELDNYLHKNAGQDERRNINRVFVITSRSSPRTVLGYYTLSTLSVIPTQFPIKIARRLPTRPVPAVLMGRLAVELSKQKTGIGKLLLTSAIRRTQTIAKDVGIYALLVDAIDEKAYAFYQKFGFIEMEQERRLFLALNSLN